MEETMVEIMNELARYKKAINRIEDVCKAFEEGRIHITIGNDDFDKETHTYDVKSVFGIIKNHITDAKFNDAVD